MEPALDRLSVPEHVHAPAEPGEASLAMALAALLPEADPRELAAAIHEPEVPDPGRLALEAARRGVHPILHGPVPEPSVLEDALAAGLLHRSPAPSVRTATAALEAGHPALVLLDRSQLHERSPAGPHWVCLVDHGDEAVQLHDPIAEEGPDRIAWEELASILGASPEAVLLELAAPNRPDRT